MTKNIDWHKPEAIPDVKEGSEETFWIAIKNDRGVHVFPAFYQNRPLKLDDDGEAISDDALIGPDGEPISSVGWVDCKEHWEFDDYYSPLGFSEDYQLLGWAEYIPPEFSAFN